jgi:ParB family chromosome partitioning protein
MSKQKKIGLGKGLGALLPSVDFSDEKKRNFTEGSESNENFLLTLDIEKIRANPYQPRDEFDRQALEDLKNSILEHGLIQPVTVRKSINGYELVSGERRLRASKEAGLKTIECYVMNIESDREMLELAIIENVQRENLNPIEVANGYHRLIEECSYTQEEVSKKVSKDRSTVTNFLRLLKLPEKVQESLRKRLISMGHARALLALNDQAQMLAAYQIIIDKKLSVRQTESLVRDIASGKKVNEKKQKKSPVSNDTLIVLEDTANKLRQSFGTNVKITPKSKESGVISFEFYSQDDLERLIDIFNELTDNTNE